MHPQVLSETAEGIARPLLITLDWSWHLGEVPEDLRKANTSPVFKNDKKEDPGSVSFTLISKEIMEQVILEIISRHMSDKKIIRNSQHGFTQGKSCSTNLITFYDKMPHLQQGF